jgi:hypothetical protein
MRLLAVLGLVGSVAAPLALTTGCGGAARAREPAARGVEAYLDALRDDDARRAYSLLTDEVRREISYDAFAAQWKEQKAERQQQVRALEEDLRGGADLGERAKVSFPDGKALSLHRQSGSWRLEGPLLSRVHAASPHVAIELFAEALAARNYESVMRLLTARRREGIGRQVDAFSASLLRQLGDARHKISTVGKDRAELQWDDGEMQYRVILRLEGDEWRVDDVHARPTPQGTGDDAAGERRPEPPRKP